MARNRPEEEPRVWAIRDRTKVAPQTSLARAMRRMPTMAEKRLWRHLHRLSVSGSHFRRQVRLGRYIVDFVSHKARLVIEVDGGQHAENVADAGRTKFIEGQGYRVLHFWNNDVLGNIEGVLEVIQSAVAAAVAATRASPISRMARGAGPCRIAPLRRNRTTPTPHPRPTRGRGGVCGEGEP